jgi:hypothetical protein
MRYHRGAAARPSKYARWRKSGRRRWHPPRRDSRDHYKVLHRSRTVHVEVRRPHVHVVPDSRYSFGGRVTDGWVVHTFKGNGQWEASQHADTKQEAQRIAARIRRALWSTP